ncbi:MAG: MerR family transcriptional regulator [Bacilli bacterium]|nr:MerR family transcriptional regulator [Bacilli bacterium]
MNIHEVEHLVGLSKKSIRYYEEHGLLKPQRNRENDYRIYEDKDIRKLKVIKFLRELDVSINDLKRLNDGVLSLQECMKDRIHKIEAEETKFIKVKEMCFEIQNKADTFDSFDVQNYFLNMNTLNKEGFTLRNVHTNKAKKIRGAIISSFVFSSFFLFLIGVISWFQFMESDQIPWIIYLFFVLLFGFPVIGMIYNLVVRIREINGGEEDEASKY